MNAPIRYKGYEVAPSAQRLPNGLYAANLTIGTLSAAPPPSQPATGTPSNEAADTLRSVPRGALVSFDALDYFFDERHALAYACRWARMWIDEQRRCA
ncbi:transcriptional regulator [Paraburkholderia pallida]|uniref:Transcriptional regulator n=1 Tax=Paraburkholderia pallida TaxID=2547399 RepID=A0A4P7D1C9_9BURK|nr:transcriptional regulator [Paraburkholderia pallida]QBR00530.1 transcriptional regulator [Paraburkholderia pallida]